MIAKRNEQAVQGGAFAGTWLVVGIGCFFSDNDWHVGEPPGDRREADAFHYRTMGDVRTKLPQYRVRASMRTNVQRLAEHPHLVDITTCIMELIR